MKQKIIFGGIIALALLVIYLPTILIVIFSFSQHATMSWSNYDFGFGLFRDLFANRSIMPAVLNSFILATVSALLAVIIGTMACLTFNNLTGRWRKSALTLNNIPLITADIVIAFAVSLMFVLLGVSGSGWFTLILSHTLIALPIVAIIVLPKLKSLDRNLFEAGQDLGASPTRAFWGILVPQLLPAMLIAFALGFTFSMNDFIITSHNNDGIMTLSMVIYTARGLQILALFRALSALMLLLVLVIIAIISIVKITRQTRKKPVYR